jgi:hypothetical protein
MTKEEAIEKYRKEHQIELNSDLKESEESFVQEEKAAEIVEVSSAAPAQEVNETTETKSVNNSDSLDEYNPDDEKDDENAGNYGYGWGYNDAFDKPEDEEEAEILDEDELYAKGLDKDDKEKEE